MLEPLERFVHPGMTSYDIGAHFGFWALTLSRLCGPAGKVFAFDEATTIDRFCRENPSPEFLLINVEGFAGAVLRGAAETFARQDVSVICEIHHAREAQEFNDLMRGREIRQLGRGKRFPYHVLATPATTSGRSAGAL